MSNKRIRRASLAKINVCQCGCDRLSISLQMSNLWVVRCLECLSVICYLGCSEIEKIRVIEKLEWNTPIGLL